MRFRVKDAWSFTRRDKTLNRPYFRGGRGGGGGVLPSHPRRNREIPTRPYCRRGGRPSFTYEYNEKP